MNYYFSKSKVLITNTIVTLAIFFALLFLIFLVFRLSTASLKAILGIQASGLIMITGESKESTPAIYRLNGDKLELLADNFINREEAMETLGLIKGQAPRISRIGPVVVWVNDGNRIFFLAGARDTIVPLDFPHIALMRDGQLYLVNAQKRQKKIIRQVSSDALIQAYPYHASP